MTGLARCPALRFPVRAGLLLPRRLHATPMGGFPRRRRRRGTAARTLTHPIDGDGDLPVYKAAVRLDGAACPGCGVALQSHAPSGWGYRPAELSPPLPPVNQPPGSGSGAGRPTTHGCANHGSTAAAVANARHNAEDLDGTDLGSIRLCQRCHRLRHHNDVDVRQMTPLQARRELQSALAHRRCIVVKVVDLLDFHGSFVPSMHQLVGQRRPVLIVGTAQLFLLSVPRASLISRAVCPC
eukprot:COSAG01_NODE_131_length_24907_cov_19.802201_11_plen_239_part_00